MSAVAKTINHSQNFSVEDSQVRHIRCWLVEFDPCSSRKDFIIKLSIQSKVGPVGKCDSTLGFKANFFLGVDTGP